MSGCDACVGVEAEHHLCDECVQDDIEATRALRAEVERLKAELSMSRENQQASHARWVEVTAELSAERERLEAEVEAERAAHRRSRAELHPEIYPKETKP